MRLAWRSLQQQQSKAPRRLRKRETSRCMIEPPHVVVRALHSKPPLLSLLARRLFACNHPLLHSRETYCSFGLLYRPHCGLSRPLLIEAAPLSPSWMRSIRDARHLGHLQHGVSGATRACRPPRGNAQPACAGRRSFAALSLSAANESATSSPLKGRTGKLYKTPARQPAFALCDTNRSFISFRRIAAQPVSMGEPLSREASSRERIEDLERSTLDDRLYRVITLPNKLEALLIHDAKTDKASAAMDVNVGSFSDREDMPGIAHAIEHLLFMGTEKVSPRSCHSI